jgi:hypothetical protein
MTDRPIEFTDPYAHLDDTSRELVARVIRLAISGVPHRIVARLDFVNGILGAFVTVERRGLAGWTASRPATWLPFAASTNGLFAMLLHVGEHGRLPDLPDAPTEKKP